MVVVANIFQIPLKKVKKSSIQLTIQSSIHNYIFPIPRTYFYIRPQMAWLGISLPISYHLMPRRERERERDDMSLS